MSEIRPCDALYVSARAGEAELACAARMLWERERGLRVLVVTLFDSGPATEGDLFLGLPSASERDKVHDPWAPSPERLEEAAWIADTTAILDDIFIRARPRHLYLPLGLGDFAERRVAHEAARRTLQAATARDIFFYEERPEAFISGSVRLRLGHLGARLPPVASKVVGEGGIARFLLRFQTVPRPRDPMKGLGRRLRCARLAARQWIEARAWRPQKAMGPRLQPVLHSAAASSLEAVRAAVRTSVANVGPRALGDRMVGLAGDYARRLGSGGHVERYWLLLPDREDEARAVVTASEVSALS